MTSNQDDVKRLYFETPLIESLPLSEAVGAKVYLKMENTHPPGSYKMRGISHLCQEAVSQGFQTLIVSSGGSAGLAAAYSARQLNTKCRILVPKLTSKIVISKLKVEGADVEVFGNFWNETNEKALELAKEPGCYYIHPFDHPTVWEGNSTMIREIVKTDVFKNEKPSLVVVSVGGGGLACGVIKGLKEAGWNDVPVLAMETIGADCFNQSVKSGKKITIPGITSVAVGLGSTVVCDRLMEYLIEHPITSKVVTDQEAVRACFRFADDHRVLVDPSCGVSLAAAYSGIIKNMRKEKVISDGPVLMIVCGGTHISMDILSTFKEKFQL